MICFDKIRLYVEKMDKTENFILFDFVSEKEFLYIRYRGNVTDTQHMFETEPSMIMAYDIKCTNFHFTEGSVISVPGKELMLAVERSSDNTDDYNNVIAFSISDNELFNTILSEANIEKYYNGFNVWDKVDMGIKCSPCSLEALDPQEVIDVTVFDVGQGSWNMISGEYCDTIFDCGASIFYSRNYCRNLIDNNGGLPRRHRMTSLIISHWDVDHYNLINVLRDEELKALCCVFVSDRIISLTAQNVFMRLLENCCCLNIIKSANIHGGKLMPTFIHDRYILWTGKRSKNLNTSGLALCVFGEKDMFLFPADHSYSQLWEMYEYIDKIKPDLNTYITVPHHGGKAGQKIIPKTLSHPAKAIVSTGKNNYQHPLENIRKYIYDELKFEWIRTDWERENIQITIR